MNIIKLTNNFMQLRFTTFTMVVSVILIMIQKRSVDEDYLKNSVIALALDSLVTCSLISASELKLLGYEQTWKRRI